MLDQQPTDATPHELGMNEDRADFTHLNIQHAGSDHPALRAHQLKVLLHQISKPLVE
ncbi:hypothetical protein D3C80_2239950 [compost metagenome]